MIPVQDEDDMEDEDAGRSLARVGPGDGWSGLVWSGGSGGSGDHQTRGL